MIQKKVCLLGAFAVGKTSLVARFVSSMFSDTYQTTIGVKIDKKSLQIGDTAVNLLLWDMAGQDECHKLRPSYLRGASGYLLVVDGTRRATLDQVLILHESIMATIGNVPFVLVLNKADLVDAWELDQEAMAAVTARNWTVITTSAKTGQGVEEAFLKLTQSMLAGLA
jgi:small GTP-binding protein